MKTAEKMPEVIQENNVIQVNASPLAAAERLLASGADLDKIEKMLELQERFEKNEAKKAYHQAMSEFKANPPTILKDRKVSFKNTHYSHATLGNITSIINSELAKYGLTSAWKTKQEQNGITVICTITHKLGYSESTSLTAGADTSGSKNSIQAIGSTITYLQRYTLLALTGLSTHEQDDDGRLSEVQTISEKQISQITDMINSTNADEVKFLKWMGAESVESIPVNLFNKAMAALKAKVQQ